MYIYIIRQVLFNFIVRYIYKYFENAYRETKPIYYRAIRIKITGRTKKISSNTSHKRSRMLHISYARYRYKPRKSSAFENRRGRILRPYTSKIFDSRLSLESFIAAIVKSIGSYA